MEPENLKETILNGHGIARLLAEHGVQYIFGIPDGHTLAFYDGVRVTKGLTHILVNDERTAAFAADAYGRVTGTLGACDAGPAGAMNFPVGIAEAYGAGSPILALVSVVKTKDILRNVPHDINVAEVLTPITKWTGRVTASEHLPRFLNFAIRQAINGRPGPVALVIPEDIFASKDLPLRDFIPEAGGACSINGCRAAPASGEIDHAVKLIQHAQQPAFFTGGQAVQAGAFPEVETLAQMLKAPVFTTISGKGIMLSDNNFHFGTVGLFGEKPNHTFLRRRADLLIVVGNRLTEDDTAYFKVPPPNLPLIQIDLDPAIIGLSYRPWGIVGDPKVALALLHQQLKTLGPVADGDSQAILAKREQNISDLRTEHVKFREKDTATWINADPIKPQRVLKSIADVLTGADYLVTDASASARWIGPYFPVKSVGRKIITARGVGPTGFGVGGLLGTCIAANSQGEQKAKKVLFTGDGGLLNGGVSDLETFQKLGLSCTIVVINNNSLGFVRFGQAAYFPGSSYETDRPALNFAPIAESFGWTGFTVEHLPDLDPAIATAIKGGGLNLVDVKVDKKELLPPSFY